MLRLLSGLLALAALMPQCEAEDADSVALKYRSYRTWSLKLPTETWFPVKEGIRLAHAEGDLFAFEFSGTSLKVDTDGDGELDRTIKALVDPKTMVSTTRVILSGKDSSGNAFRYAARLRNDADGWEWAPGGAMVGSIPTTAGPVPVKLIDQDGNGKFNDVGSDAMIVGNTDHAMMLSTTMFVDGKLLLNRDLNLSVTLEKSPAGHPAEVQAQDQIQDEAREEAHDQVQFEEPSVNKARYQVI